MLIKVFLITIQLHCSFVALLRTLISHVRLHCIRNLLLFLTQRIRDGLDLLIREVNYIVSAIALTACLICHKTANLVLLSIFTLHQLIQGHNLCGCQFKAIEVPCIVILGTCIVHPTLHSVLDIISHVLCHVLLCLSDISCFLVLCLEHDLRNRISFLAAEQAVEECFWCCMVKSERVEDRVAHLAMSLSALGFLVVRSIHHLMRYISYLLRRHRVHSVDLIHCMTHIVEHINDGLKFIRGKLCDGHHSLVVSKDLPKLVSKILI